MGFSLFYYALGTIVIYIFIAPETKAADDITTCCSTGDGCCGSDWELHCCNFVAKICCYGEKRVRALHHHNHRQWHLNRHWLQVMLCIMLLMLIITGILLCCKVRRRSGNSIREYKILPGYEYDSPQNILPTAPVVQTFQTTDEYPLMEYHNGRPQAYSVNATQMSLNSPTAANGLFVPENGGSQLL